MKNPFKYVAISGVALSLLAFPVVSKPLMIPPSTAYASEDEDEGERDEVEGTIEAVDTANATVTVNGKKYTMAPEAKIEKEEYGKIAASELGKYVGAKAELKLNKDNMVYEVELEEADEH